MIPGLFAMVARLRPARAAVTAGSNAADPSADAAGRSKADPAEGRVAAENVGAALSLAPPVDERRRFAFNAAAGAVANVVKVVVQLVLLPVMARLLGPAEFGLFALALPTVTFFITMADGGLGASLARERETSTAVWSTAFWALLSSCSLLALLTVAGGFVLGALSHQPRLPGIMTFLSLSLPMLAFTALSAARLVRRGNLVVHSIADTAATISGAAAAVGLALAGAGVWALAVQFVLGSAVSCLIISGAAFERPTLEFRPAALKAHAVTGGTLIGSRLSDLLGRQAENLLFGRLFGAAALGSYTFANQTSRFLCEAAGNPLWGALYSHALRGEERAVASLHGTLSRLLAWALFPVSALLAASAPQVFDLVLGPQWAAAALLVRILVPFYALSTIATQCSAVLLARGRNRPLFWGMTGLSAGRLLAVALGPWVGPTGIAWGIDVVGIAYAAAMFSAAGASSGDSAWSLARELLSPMAAAVLGGTVCHILLAQQPESFAWTAICLIFGASSYMLCLILLQGRRLVADASAIRRVVFAQRRASIGYRA